MIADARARYEAIVAKLTNDELVYLEEVIIDDCAGHWFTQGGKWQFGALQRQPRNSDELISEILQRVRNPHPDAPSSLPVPPADSLKPTFYTRHPDGFREVGDPSHFVPVPTDEQAADPGPSPEPASAPNAGKLGHLPVPPAEEPPDRNNGHIDADCEVARGVGWMCTCRTPEEKAEDAREEAESEAEADALSARPAAQPPVVLSIDVPVEVRLLLEKLREPVDLGGYDSFGQDGLHIAAAKQIEHLLVRWSDMAESLAAWQKRAYEAEAAARSPVLDPPPQEKP